MSKKIKIGETEFELPFRYDKKYSYVVDARRNFVTDATMLGRSYEADEAINKAVVDALNEKYGT